MPSTQDLNVLLKYLQGKNELQLYPVSKADNIFIDEKFRTSLGFVLNSQDEFNSAIQDEVNSAKTKLSTIENYAQVNQNAFSKIQVGSAAYSASNATDTIEITANGNIDIELVDGKLSFSLNINSIPLADSRKNGLLSSQDFIKLAGIEEGANKYIHPMSGASTEDKYVAVDVDAYGHVQSGIQNVLPLSMGGTGVTTVEDFEELLAEHCPKTIYDNTPTENSQNPVTSDGLFKAFATKADKDHGNHVPDWDGNTKFLKEGNVWTELPVATSEVSGIVTLTNDKTSTSETLATTPKMVFDSIQALKTSLINGAKSYDTFKSIEDWITTHKTEYDNLSKSVNDNLTTAKGYTDTKINELINGADSTFDTLKEIQEWATAHEDLYNGLVKTVGENLTKANEYTDSEISDLINGATTYVTLKSIEDWIKTTYVSDLAKKVDKVDGYALSKNDLTDALKANYDSAYSHSISPHSPANAERNIITKIKRNGVDLVVNENREIDITVPTKVSQLDNDSNYLTAHPTVSATSNTTTSTSPSNGGSFTVIDSLVRDTNQHVTGYNTKTVTLPTFPESLKSPNKLKFAIGTGDNRTIIEYDGGSEVDKSIELGKYIKFTQTESGAKIEGDIPNVSESTNGFMTAELFTKLSGVAEEANKYVLPEAGSNLGGVKSGIIISGTQDLNGYSPAPVKDGIVYYKDTNSTYTLKDFGVTVSATEINYLSGLKGNVASLLDSKAASTHSHKVSDITDFPTSMPASDVYSWAKQASKPTYNLDELGQGTDTIILDAGNANI